MVEPRQGDRLLCVLAWLSSNTVKGTRGLVQRFEAGAGPGPKKGPYRSLAARFQVLLLRWQDKPSQWKATGQ